MSKIRPNADMDAEVEQIIERLGLSPHPEGGCYRETYRSNEKIPPSALPGRYVGERCFGTAIYYLLTPGTFSRLHRLASDEIFHFYLGDPAIMLQLHPDGEGRQITLGPDLLAGQCVQVVVPRGVWQGTVLSEGGRFALLGTTVAPAFEFDDFELGDRAALSRQYPEYARHIERLTRP